MLYSNIDSKSRIWLLNADQAALLSESITAHRGPLEHLNWIQAGTCFVRKGAAS